MSSVSQAPAARHVRLSDVPAKMAKAVVRKADTDAFYAELGGCMSDVMRAFGLSLKEFARELGKDERQIARQIAGEDRPQIECVFAVDRFRPALVIALANKAAGVEVVTEIRVRRSA